VFRERFHQGRRAVVREVLEQWRSDSGVTANLDLEVLGDLIYGPVYMRLLVGHAPLDAAFVAAHLDYVNRLLAAPQQTEPPVKKR
jgi:tetracycline repressor-like protein